MILKKGQATGPKIPISAMSDIGFLLLVFIMLVSLIDYRQEVRIAYPEAEEISRTQASHNLEIWVNAVGTVFVDGRKRDASALEAILVDTYTQRPDTRIHIIADRAAPYRHLARVLDILQTLQHRVISLVVKEP